MLKNQINFSSIVHFLIITSAITVFSKSISFLLLFPKSFKTRSQRFSEYLWGRILEKISMISFLWTTPVGCLDMKIRCLYFIWLSEDFDFTARDFKDFSRK